MIHFWDEVVIKIKAGDGGNGSVSFASDPINPRGGPDGGDGGNGGSIALKSSSKIDDLGYFSFHRFIQADNGQNGGRNKRTGKSGEDLDLNLPLGTLVYIWNQEKRDFLKLLEFKKTNQDFLLQKGGKGGLGNAHLSGFMHSAQKHAGVGAKNKAIKLRLVLKLIAQVGLVGLPNAGKSTLLSVISKAKPKIANYPFTTLSPNLGVIEGAEKKIVVADIPGLIEGAYQGKGLGDKFLKHVERTKLLVWLIASDAVDPYLDYKTLENELGSYKQKLVKEKKIIVLTKIDLNPDYQKLVKKLEKKTGHEIIPISAVTHQNVDLLIQKITQLL